MAKQKAKPVRTKPAKPKPKSKAVADKCVHGVSHGMACNICKLAVMDGVERGRAEAKEFTNDITAWAQALVSRGMPIGPFPFTELIYEAMRLNEVFEAHGKVMRAHFMKAVIDIEAKAVRRPSASFRAIHQSIDVPQAEVEWREYLERMSNNGNK